MQSLLRSEGSRGERAQGGAAITTAEKRETEREFVVVVDRERLNGEAMRERQRGGMGQLGTTVRNSPLRSLEGDGEAAIESSREGGLGCGFVWQSHQSALSTF